jgi:type II secretory pathway pseudopilin PulG
MIAKLIIGFLCLCVLIVLYGMMREAEEKRTTVDTTTAERRERERQQRELDAVVAARRAQDERSRAEAIKAWKYSQ